MKILTKYILPAALVAGFLFYFFSDAFNRRFSLDDYFYDGLVRKFGISGSIDVCYKLANGRWFSHIVCAASFWFFGQSFFLYGVYLTFLLALFIIAACALYKNYCISFLNNTPSFLSQLHFAFTFAATLYFLLFEGRWETWGWVSSANTHLLSVIISMFLFSVLLKEIRSGWSLGLAFILSLFMGGLNEVNAVCSIFAIIGLYILNRAYFPTLRLNKFNMLVSVAGIGVSLFINICSGGYKLRMEGLPDFTIVQSFKNTVHSFLMPVLQYQFLPITLIALTTFFLFVTDNPITVSKRQWIVIFFTLLISGLSYFLHCYTLSDVIPARGAIWAYSLMLFVSGTLFISGKNISN